MTKQITSFELGKKIRTTALTITGVEKAVLSYLIDHMNYHEGSKFMTAWPSIITLANLSGFSRNTVQRSLKNLQTLGFIDSKQRSDNSKIFTWLTIPSKCVKGAEELKVYVKPIVKPKEPEEQPEPEELPFEAQTTSEVLSFEDFMERQSNVTEIPAVLEEPSWTQVDYSQLADEGGY